MPRKPRVERVSGQYYTWLLGQREGVYCADGRSNAINLGRHSLRTRDRSEAYRAISKLDLQIAEKHGLYVPPTASEASRSVVPLLDGQRRYLEYVARPVIQGGVTPRSHKRYRTVLNKFVAFATKQGLHAWHEVDKDVLMRYGSWLEHEDYHDKTQYTELTVLKSVVKWMVNEKLLDEKSIVRLPLKKPIGTNTYCYSSEQVQAMLDLARSKKPLHWLSHVIVALATTGLRIGELAELRWSDLHLEKGMILLQDSSRRSRRSKRKEARQTKSHRDRCLPIHDELKVILQEVKRLEDGRVFHGPLGGKLKPDTVRKILKIHILDELDPRFPAKDGERGIAAGRLHSFRHYFCSFSANHGVAEQMLMSWLGHADSDMIRHYYHLQHEQSKEQMQRLPFVVIKNKDFDKN